MAENPIDRMFDAVYAHHGLPWQFRKFDVAKEDLPAAIAGTRALGFRDHGITVPYKIADKRVVILGAGADGRAMALELGWAGAVPAC